MTMSLSRLLASARREDASVVVEVGEDWMQGRSVFGGLQVAIAVQAMRVLVPQAALRTLQATLIAPIAGTVRASARILRAGKNVTHVEARIGDGAATQAIVIGVFGTPRNSVVARSLVPRVLDPSAPPLFEMPFGRADIAGFMQHFQTRWLSGGLPFTGSRESQVVVEVAIDDEGPASEATILAIADFIPPIAFSHLTTAAAGSTLTWMLELLVDRADHLPTAGFRVEGEMVAARDGYTSQTSKLFAPSGEPIALSHQAMLVFG